MICGEPPFRMYNASDCVSAYPFQMPTWLIEMSTAVADDQPIDHGWEVVSVVPDAAAECTG